MPYTYTKDARTKHGTFRTYAEVLDDLTALADKVDRNIYYWKHTNPMRNCKTRSGMIHEVMSGNISLSDIKSELKKREAENESN